MGLGEISQILWDALVTGVVLLRVSPRTEISDDPPAPSDRDQHRTPSDDERGGCRPAPRDQPDDGIYRSGPIPRHRRSVRPPERSPRRPGAGADCARGRARAGGADHLASGADDIVHRRRDASMCRRPGSDAWKRRPATTRAASVRQRTVPAAALARRGTGAVPSRRSPTTARGLVAPPAIGRSLDGYVLPLMTDRWDGATPDASQRLQVNFQEARRRIEALEEFSTSVRARALAAYVGVFDFADANGCVEVSSDEIASSFRISRVSWLQYRGLLAKAGLLEVQARHGGVRRGFRLVPPISQEATEPHNFPLR